jgi:hypothetical protein
VRDSAAWQSARLDRVRVNNNEQIGGVVLVRGVGALQVVILDLLGFKSLIEASE